VTWHTPINAGESQACLRLTQGEVSDLNERIRVALGYMDPPKIAQYLGVSVYHVETIRNHTPYRRIKGLRDQVRSGRR
jgi:hypothetical protein